MLFVGTTTHSLDSKGRVVIPAVYRQALQPFCYVTKGRDGQLDVFSADRFEFLGDEWIKSATAKDRRKKKRAYFAQAVQSKVDSQGRMIVAPILQEYAHLADEVTVVGNGDRLELWNPERFDAEIQAGDAAYLDDDEEVGFVQ